MKLSLTWIFDHISESLKNTVTPEQIAEEFNKVTAEIEHVEKISWDLSNYFCAVITGKSVDSITLEIPELSQNITLGFRTDLFDGPAGYLVKRSGDRFEWASLQAFGLEKEGLIPAVKVSEAELAGSWRESFESEDIIFDVDNKSITHRPDMWGHRGFAREIAATHDLELLPESRFLSEINYLDATSPEAKSINFSLENHDNEGCSVIHGFSINSVTHEPSDLKILSRFLKVGYRPINHIVDVTNYVMADWGHPMHAYDADRVSGKKLIVRRAENSEKLVLLDESELELNSNDVVIADSEKLLGLGGIMGGRDDSVLPSTKSLLLEAAVFHPAIARRSSARHKVRTDASQRFEKTLDPVTAGQALERFIKLAEDTGLDFSIENNTGLCAGENISQKKACGEIEITHDFIESRIGVSLEQDFIVKTLEKLGFQVAEKSGNYRLVVPSYRTRKDITIKEDIVEEISRFYRFDNIPHVLPVLEKHVGSIDRTLKKRELSEYFARSGRMMEQRNYAIYDENILDKLSWDISKDKTLSIKNPVSQDQYRLVTSLLPHLAKNIIENKSSHESLRFFEWGKTWNFDTQASNQDTNGEALTSSLVFYEKRKEINFYDIKEIISGALALAGYDSSEVTWAQRAEYLKSNPGIDNNFISESEPWADNYQTALLLDGNNTIIGLVGRATREFTDKMGLLPESSLYFSSLDGELLLRRENSPVAFKPAPKFPGSSFDLSVMIPLSCSVDQLEDLLAGVSPLVSRAYLIDFFEKKEWTDKRSVALRVEVISHERSLTKEDIEQVRNIAIEKLVLLGGELRA